MIHASRSRKWILTSKSDECFGRLHVIEGLIVSGAVIGAAVGSATGGYVSDRLGRKAALKTADVFFLVGSVTMASSQSATLLIIGTLLCPSLDPLHRR